MTYYWTACATSIHPTKPWEQNSYTHESFDPADHSDKAEYEDEEMLQEGIKNPTPPRKELGEGDMNLI